MTSAVGVFLVATVVAASTGHPAVIVAVIGGFLVAFGIVAATVPRVTNWYAADAGRRMAALGGSGGPWPLWAARVWAAMGVLGGALLLIFFLPRAH